ncbi:NADPH-adrenodoxin reductase [Lecanora helva]
MWRLTRGVLNDYRKVLRKPQSGSSFLIHNKIHKCYESSTTKDGSPFRMAVLGSGPAGFYTAYKVMSSIENAVVDMYESLPVPFGLVRFGVAPDHPEVKNCQEKFEEVASSPRFNFIGNIEVGKDLPLVSLKSHYNAILFSYGATEDKKLGIPGENSLQGIYSARDFVGWYNGLPDKASMAPNLELSDEAVIVGQGNVALDVARTLLSNVDSLRKTDMTDYALATLAKSRVKRVHVVGRRGPMQAAFTIREVRELMNLPSVSFAPIKGDLFPSDIAKLQRTPKRLIQLLSKGSSTLDPQAQKKWSLDFLLSPMSFESSDKASNTLSSILFQKQTLKGPDKYQRSTQVEPTADLLRLNTSLAFRSIGYKSEAINGMQDLDIEFDNVRGVIPNDSDGRIITPSASGAHIPGLYCSGWVKRGPAGVIANTMEDAFGTANAITNDLQNRQPFMRGEEGWTALQAEARRKGLRPISWSDWQKIDAAEKDRGKLVGKEREKFPSAQEMLATLE